MLFLLHCEKLYESPRKKSLSCNQEYQLEPFIALFVCLRNSAQIGVVVKGRNEGCLLEESKQGIYKYNTC